MCPNLQGLQVLVTRPAPQGNLLCQAIADQKGQGIYFPTVSFAPPQNEANYHKAIANLSQQDWLIFVSPRAVYVSVESIRKRWSTLPPSIKIAAVGEGTAQALRKAGYFDVLTPLEWTSEGLLALKEFQSVAGMQIAIIRGLGGRELIDKVLIGRGATVLTVIAYERILPDISNDKILSLLEQKVINRIICTSFSGVNNLQQLLDKKYWPHLHSIPLIVVSERIKILAQDLGFQTIWVASNASNDAILEVLNHKGTSYDR